MSITVSAPGKVILFGDHSVVFDRLAIAASITLRTTLRFQQHTDRSLCLDFPDIQLHLIVTADEIRTLTKCSSYPDSLVMQPRDLDHTLHQESEVLVRRHNVTPVAQAAAVAFLYLYMAMGLDTQEGSFGAYTLTSKIPIGAGLGSSASVSVTIATVFLLLSSRIESPDIANSNGTSSHVQHLINYWAYVGEQCIHGTPSGVDNTVATFGGAVAYRKTQHIQRVEFPPLPLLLTNTGIPRSTKALVGRVAALRENFPTIVESILEAMHEIASEAQTLLPNSRQELRRLGALVQMNQGLLTTLGVSHSSIDDVIRKNEQKGWTKLTGAGGGGCVITLLKEFPEMTAEVDQRDLDNQEEYMVTLGGPGVGFHTSTAITYYKPTSE